MISHFFATDKSGRFISFCSKVVVHLIQSLKGLKTGNGNELFFPQGELIETAKRTDFCERLRVIHLVIFLMTLLTYRSFHSVPTFFRDEPLIGHGSEESAQITAQYCLIRADIYDAVCSIII